MAIVRVLFTDVHRGFKVKSTFVARVKYVVINLDYSILVWETTKVDKLHHNNKSQMVSIQSIV